MNALRWALAGVLLLAGGGWLLLSILAGGFRKSFGASEINPLIVALPIVAMAILLGGLLLPGNRNLLHAGAVAAIGLAILGGVQLVRESATVFVFVELFLVAWLIFYLQAAWHVGAARALAPSQLPYPVLLVDEGRISEVCLDADELTLRPENTDHAIEQRFQVIDASGRRYRIRNFRSAEARPSTLQRVFSATVFNVKRFRVAFELMPEAVLSRDQVLTQLRDREWAMPAQSNPTTSLTELFRAYRADRFREYGNARDRMPDVQAPMQSPASSNP